MSVSSRSSSPSPTLNPKVHPSISSVKQSLLCQNDGDDIPNNLPEPFPMQDIERIGVGTFAEVYLTQLPGMDRKVAVKKILQDRNFKNREIQIMKVLDHPNCVKMHNYFISEEKGSQNSYLHIVMEYVPMTLATLNQQYVRKGQRVPLNQLRIFAYQLFRACAYIHGFGIVHRDLKPQNVLVDPVSNELKLCDFGSAKVIQEGDQSICYICSRFYRAPELVFGAVHYGSSSDMWSIGCIIAELLLGRPLFQGNSNDEQMRMIVQAFGTPTPEDMDQMRSRYACPYPNLKPAIFSRLFPSHASPVVVDLLSKLLIYSPSQRMTAAEALTHPFFDSLSDCVPDVSATNQNTTQNVPPLFNFLDSEMEMNGPILHSIWSKHESRFPEPQLVGTSPSKLDQFPNQDDSSDSISPTHLPSSPPRTVFLPPPLADPSSTGKMDQLTISVPAENIASRHAGILIVPPNTAKSSLGSNHTPLSPGSHKSHQTLSPSQQFHFTFPLPGDPQPSLPLKPRKPNK
ncbi:putative Glycogen synthase kinase-3 beta [Blattamonas nauphoetae]|uniref:Glycogen synthase kinase-3 beta n=1 Tax=Blattamonas nauphoetae TaxID=2049346 RepID=A0ABQ9Y0E5_9EUKA|nr:putative Glycogen synthase kinase-3 beta [Blattamonas nauphoetae]